MTQSVDDALPHSIYMTLATSLSCAQVVKLFVAKGWSWRMCSWTEYEIESDYAELIIVPELPILVSGGIARGAESITKIMQILTDAGIEAEYEAFDEHDKPIQPLGNLGDHGPKSNDDESL